MPVYTGKATDFVNFSRGSLATVTDSDGKIKWAPHNFLTDSESFDNSAWTKDGTTITANQFAAPNGTTTADRMVTTSGVNVSKNVRRLATLSDGVYTLSVFVKDNTSAARSIEVGFLSTNFLTGGLVLYNFDTAAITYSVNGTYSYVSSSATPVGNGWVLIVAQFAVTSAQHNIWISAPYAQSPAGNFYIWGAHLYRSDLGGMQSNGSAYPFYNSTTPKNLFSYTENFSASDWYKGGVISVVPNATISPNGMMNASKLVESATTDSHTIYWTGGLQTGSKTFSIYAKPAGRNYFCLYDGYNGTLGAIVVDLTTGNVTQNTAQITVNVVPAAQGFYRISVSHSRTNDFTYMFGPNNTASIPNSYQNTYTGDGVSGIYIWGIQLSDSASVDPYVANHFGAPTSAAYYGPRVDYDPVTRAAKGLLVEEQRTNFLSYTQSVGDNTWFKLSSSGVAEPIVTTNAAISPTGSQTASKIVFPTTTNSQISKIYHSAISTTTAFTNSIYLRGEIGGEVVYLIGYNGAGYFYTTCTLTTSWQRFTSSTNSSTAAYLQLGQESGAGTAGMNACTIYAWGAQLEVGSFATSYIPTVGSQVTRNSDVVNVSTNAFSYNGNEGTIIISGSNMRGGTSYSATFASFDDGNGGYDNARNVYFNTSGDIVLFEKSNDVTSVPNVTLYNGPSNSEFTGNVAYAYAINSFNASYNGNATVSVSTSGNPALNVSRMGIGTDFPALSSGGTGGQAYIRQITYIPRRLTNTELQQRTL